MALTLEELVATAIVRERLEAFRYRLDRPDRERSSHGRRAGTILRLLADGIDPPPRTAPAA